MADHGGNQVACALGQNAARRQPPLVPECGENGFLALHGSVKRAGVEDIAHSPSEPGAELGAGWPPNEGCDPMSPFECLGDELPAGPASGADDQELHEA